MGFHSVTMLQLLGTLTSWPLASPTGLHGSKSSIPWRGWGPRCGWSCTTASQLKKLWSSSILNAISISPNVARVQGIEWWSNLLIRLWLWKRYPLCGCALRLAQYLLRNHPTHTSDHRDGMCADDYRCSSWDLLVILCWYLEVNVSWFHDSCLSSGRMRMTHDEPWLSLLLDAGWCR